MFHTAFSRFVVVVSLAAGVLALCGPAWGQSPYHWSAGPSTDPNIFPISVWWQSYSMRAAEWAGIGVNYIVGPDAPSSSDATLLRNLHMKVMINYNSSQRGSNVVTGW